MQGELPILVEVRRGAIIESRHRGAIVIAEPNGDILAKLGDENLITSTRSTIKPIQAIPFVTSGAADHFNVDERELAVICASHEGEPIHTEAVVRARAFGLLEPKRPCARKRSSTPPHENVYSPGAPITPPQTTLAITLSCRYRTAFWSYPSCRPSAWPSWHRRSDRS